MKISLTAFTDRGAALAERLTAQLKTENHEADFVRCGGNIRVAGWTKEHFADDALIFVGACGIAVRAIAPHVKSKAEDPAVVVIDETGKYAIPILSGHLGGANELAVRLAGMIGAEAVITTATDVCGVFAFDDWARRMNCAVADVTEIRRISGAMLAGRTVFVRSDFEIAGIPPAGVCMDAQGTKAARDTSPVNVCMDVQGTEAARDTSPANVCMDAQGAEAGSRAEDGSETGTVRITILDEGCSNALVIIPRIVCVGVGARRGTAMADITKAVSSVFSAAGISPKAMCAVCSIDLKADEEGIKAYAKEMNVPFVTFSAAELRKVPGDFSASEFVASVTGVDNVCERAAVCAARSGSPGTARARCSAQSVEIQGEMVPVRPGCSVQPVRTQGEMSLARAGGDATGELICRKTIMNGVTVALAVRKARLSWDG